MIQEIGSNFCYYGLLVLLAPFNIVGHSKYRSKLVITLLYIPMIPFLIPALVFILIGWLMVGLPSVDDFPSKVCKQ